MEPPQSGLQPRRSGWRAARPRGDTRGAHASRVAADGRRTTALWCRPDPDGWYSFGTAHFPPPKHPKSTRSLLLRRHYDSGRDGLVELSQLCAHSKTIVQSSSNSSPLAHGSRPDAMRGAAHGVFDGTCGVGIALMLQRAHARRRLLHGPSGGRYQRAGELASNNFVNRVKCELAHSPRLFSHHINWFRHSVILETWLDQ